MEGKAEHTNSKQRMEKKLALLEKEVKLVHQHMSQTLLRSKEALLRKKVRVTYNNCYKFWRYREAQVSYH